MRISDCSSDVCSSDLVLRKLAAQGRTYVSILLHTIVRSPLKDLSAFAAGTDAAAFISMEGERTSAGVQAELASVMRSFAYLDDTDDGLSIRDWVATEGADSWPFVTVKADQLPSLRQIGRATCRAQVCQSV